MASGKTGKARANKTKSQAGVAKLRPRTNLATTDIGQIGQKLVCMLASAAGATPNESFNDQRGWDVLLQFDVNDDGSGPLDRAPPQRTCWLQVKTTTTLKRSWPIKLTNWGRMVNDPSPWFVVIVHLDTTNNPSTLHVVHVDEKWSAVALKELRKASKAGGKAANRVKPAINWSDADLLPEITGKALMAKLDAAIGPDYERYVRDKPERNQSLGYDDAPHSITVSVRGASDAIMSELADLAVGLRRVMPGDWSATAHDIRFGIPHQLRAFDRTSGDMMVTAGAQGDLLLRVESGGPWPPVEIQCEAFRARNVFPFLPEAFDKVRIVSKHVSVLMSSDSAAGMRRATVTTSLSVEEPLPLAEIERAARTVLHLADPGGATLSVSSEGRTSVMKPQIELPPGDQLAAFHFFESVAYLCREFGLPDDAPLDLGVAVRQREHFEFMANLMRDPVKGPLTLVGSGVQAQVGEQIGAVGVVSAQAGDVVLFAIYGMYGATTSCEKSGAKWRTEAEQISMICDKHVVPVSEHENFDLRGAIDSMRSKLGLLGLQNVFVDPIAVRQSARSGAGRSKRRPAQRSS